MKRTTTSVFVLPVRPQSSRNCGLYGDHGCAAGAHAPDLPAAQGVQPKSESGSTGGGAGHRTRGRHHLLAGLLMLTLTSLPVWPAKRTPTRQPTPPAANIQTQDIKIADPATLPKEAQPAACTEPGSDLAPTMVILPPGRIVMGSPTTGNDRAPDESPEHVVTIPRPFALSRCEITVRQFRRFVQETGHRVAEKSGDCRVWDSQAGTWKQKAGANWEHPGFDQPDDHPVTCVNWDDARAYAAWLSARTGATYRLPTEAEWEYAARGWVPQSRFWGDDPEQGCAFANGADAEAAKVNPSWKTTRCSDGYAFTAPVAHYRPNHFGLYDMAGNVWEWTTDCWHDSYRGAPDDGSAWDAGECDRRVVRGGSWYLNPQNLRSAYRFWGRPDAAYINLGFRVARAL